MSDHVAKRSNTSRINTVHPVQKNQPDSRGCIADFLSPARLDDQLVVASRLLDLRGASVDLEQNVTRGGFDLVRLRVELACMSTGRAARLPARVRAALAEFSGNTWFEDGKQRG